MGAADDVDNLVQPGEVLAGKYRIDRVIGKGGMGVVVAAHHMQLDERVAIKFLLPSAVGKPELLARFEREARAAVKIKSEHIARVIDVGVLDNGAPYMVMEYLQGADLSQRIEGEGRIPVEQAADFILQACEAIVEAHALGIVHRDLKPANLFVVRRADGLQSIKVLDFGISKSTGLGGADMTQTQSMLGSPYYMSPEQMQSARSVDARTDIWALGCILFQAVTGEVPFGADSLPELVLKIVSMPPVPVAHYRNDVPPAFEKVILRCLEKDRDRRFRHVGELATALVPFAHERSRASAERILRVVQTSGMGATAASPSPSSPNLPAGKLATQQLLASPVGPSGPPQPYDSRAGGTVQYASPPQISSSSQLSPPPGTVPPTTGSNPRFGVTSSSASWGKTSAGGARANSTTTALALIGLLVVFGSLAIGGYFLFGRRVLGQRSPDASGIVSTAVDASAPFVLPTASISSEPVVVEPPPKEEKADAGGPEVVATGTDGGAPHPVLSAAPIVKPVPGPNPTAGPTTTKPPAANCNPPYYYDEKRNRVFKKECL